MSGGDTIHRVHPWRGLLVSLAVVALAVVAPCRAEPAPLRTWVVGDSTALPLKLGFESLRPTGFRVRTFFRNSSGLIRTDQVDWPRAMRAELQHGAPDVVVVTLGSNDAQGLIVRGAREPIALGSDAWIEAYAAKVRAFAELFLARGATVYVCLQTYDEQKKHAPAMRAIDAALRRAVQSRPTSPRLELVDVPALLARAPAATDPHTEPLRHADGIHLTRRGGRWVASQLVIRALRHGPVAAP